MARKELNIVDRGKNATEWMAEDFCLQSEDLDKVLEQKTDNSGALNSLPTPFARFFVAREAFRRVREERADSSKGAGYAYRQLVSDILDVYEILFNLTFHRNKFVSTGEKIEIREWDSRINLSVLNQRIPKLYNSINEYYQTDITENKLYFVVYTNAGKDILLACSSPMTGFVTPPDMDKHIAHKGSAKKTVYANERYNNVVIHRKSGGLYFNDIKMFEDRDEDFKNFMYNEMFSSGNMDEKFKNIKEYIASFKDDKDIRNDYKLKLESVLTDQNDYLVINGLQIKASAETDINSYFTDTLIRLPYRIEQEKFKSVTYKVDDKGRDCDYLLPFKPDVVSLFDNGEIDSCLHIKREKIQVDLRYNGKVYSKSYCKEPIMSDEGRIIDMADANINFDLGLFPNILSYREEENNYFKVMLVAADNDPEAPTLNIDGISLAFYKTDGGNVTHIKEYDRDKAEFGVMPAVVRSRQKKDDMDGGTKFYELFNTSFDFIEITMLGHSGLLKPRWERSESVDESYTYAIDLGTSSTFMSRCKDGNNNLPEMFKMMRPMVSYLHESPNDKQLSHVSQIEDSAFELAKKRIRTEFLPAMIDGCDYKFPIRTAVCGLLSKASAPHLFDNHNIAFFYERLMADDDQRVYTDIKWDEKDRLLRLFIRELLLIIKCDVLQRNGDLNRTKLVWFHPLSFMGNVRTTYNSIWEREPKDILFVDSSQVSCFSESEAPYYYFKKKDYIKDSNAVTVIDIGGGSTDIVYFKDNEPQLANSVHFGCDVLWENGFSGFDNERQNGIYNRYAETLKFSNEELNALYCCFRDVDSYKTKDIINFWLSNSDKCDIKSRLNRDFKPVFVYHFTAILYYMALMCKDKQLDAPRTVIFSGNGSRYIDDFICKEKHVIQDVINMVFGKVFGRQHDVFTVLPDERKESTCYGGLYREADAKDVPEIIYQGDNSMCYEKVGDVNKNFDKLETSLCKKYDELAEIYGNVLALLKKERIIDNGCNTSAYVTAAKDGMDKALETYYKTQVKEKYQDEVVLHDSVFFLPIINKVFEMTKI